MKFIPRFEAPSADNKYYINENYGGYNKFIVVGPNGSSIPNCTAFAFGRYMEEQGITSCKLPQGDCNAKNFFSHNDGYARGQEPKLGAIICFDGGQYGHVAIVEEITDKYINCSNSMYGGSKFYMKKYYKKDGYSFQGNTGYYKCQGFIYPEADFNENKPESAPEPQPTPTIEFEIGDKVIIKGMLYYTAFDETPSGEISERETTITRKCRGAKHPYNTEGDPGWMDASSIRKVESTTEEPIKEGDWVVPIEKIDYYGTSVVQYDDKYQVTELAGDRAVLCALRDGQLVTWCAMNINNIKKA